MPKNISVDANGLRFHVTSQGDGPPLVLLHGFTGQSASWAEVTARLAGSHEIFTIDLVGHGASEIPAEPSRFAFASALDDLAEVAAKLGLTRASFLGYSMGGRLALGLALRHPRLVTSLILEGASPGIADPAERSARQHADESLATRIVDVGVEAFVAEWESLPLWDSQRHLPFATRHRQRAIRLSNSPIGLAGSLRGMGSGAQPSYWDQLSQLRCPVLLIAGSLDAKFAAIAEQMSEKIPQSELCIFPGAGHAVHLEQPAAYADRISRFVVNNSPRLQTISGGER